MATRWAIFTSKEVEKSAAVQSLTTWRLTFPRSLAVAGSLSARAHFEVAHMLRFPHM